MKTLTTTLALLVATALLAQPTPEGGTIVTDDVVAYFKGAYNPPHHNLGVRDGRYFPYQTPFGGRRIGYRSAIADKQLYRSGLSKEEADALLRKNLQEAEADLRSHLKEKHPGKALDALPPAAREILLDFAYFEGSAANVREDVYRAVIAGDWQSFIHDMIYVRSKNGSPDSTLNRAFADRWIYSNKLIPAKKDAK